MTNAIDDPILVGGVPLYGCRHLTYVDDAFAEIPTPALYPYRDGFMTHPETIERLVALDRSLATKSAA